MKTLSRSDLARAGVTDAAILDAAERGDMAALVSLCALAGDDLPRAAVELMYPLAREAQTVTAADIRAAADFDTTPEFEARRRRAKAADHDCHSARHGYVVEVDS